MTMGISRGAPSRGIALAVALAAVVGVHAVARAQTLTELDSTNLALALRHFDVRLQQPHPPGYPLVVAAAHALSWLGGALQAYLAFALIASVGAIIATFLLGRELFAARAGSIAALLLAASPLFLYYASIVSVYPAETLFGPLVVLVAARVAQRSDSRSALALAPTLAIGAGFRPTMLVLLLPVCALAVVIGRPPRWPLLIGVAVGAAIVAAWVIPVLAKSGGLSGYLHASSLYSRASHGRSLLNGASFAGARYNAVQAIAAIVLGAAPSLLVLLFGILRGGLRTDHRLPWLLLAAWMVPYVLLYVFVLFGKPGYAAVCIPAFAVAAGGAARDERLGLPLAGVLAAAGVVFFLSAPSLKLPHRLSVYRMAAFLPTADAIRVQDREARFLPAVARRCPRTTCTIVSLGTANQFWPHEPWDLQRWYAPGARVPRLSDLGGRAPPGATVYWIGGQVPLTVAHVARPLPPVGQWQVYVSEGSTTQRLEGLLGLRRSPGSSNSLPKRRTTRLARNLTRRSWISVPTSGSPPSRHSAPSAHLGMSTPSSRILGSLTFWSGTSSSIALKQWLRPTTSRSGDHAGTIFLTNYRADDQNTVSDGITDVRVPICTLDDALLAVRSFLEDWIGNSIHGTAVRRGLPGRLLARGGRRAVRRGR